MRGRNMKKTFFSVGDYIKNEDGNNIYQLLEEAKYNDKYYVVKAEDVNTKKTCLLKFAEQNQDAYKLNNLTREGEFQFYYPYIEKVYGNFEGIDPFGNLVFGVAVEFITGETLAEFRGQLEKMVAFDEMDEEDAEWLIYRQMLQFLHGMRYYMEYAKLPYLHRDIKPENVMITDSSEVVIVDFDYAHIAGSDRTVSISGWDMAFSRGYTSPDVFATPQNNEWSFTTDIYSAGRLFFFWLNGCSYFTDEQLMESQSGKPSSIKYCLEPDLGYGFKVNRNRYKKKYLKEEYVLLREMLDKMCCNPKAEEPYHSVSEIIEDMEYFLLTLCDWSIEKKERLLQRDQWRLLQESKMTDDRPSLLVTYKFQDGDKIGHPLYLNAIREIRKDGSLFVSLCNKNQQVFYIPTFGRQYHLQKSNDRNEQNDPYMIENGDVLVCDGIRIEFTIV